MKEWNKELVPVFVKILGRSSLDATPFPLDLSMSGGVAFCLTLSSFAVSITFYFLKSSAK